MQWVSLAQQLVQRYPVAASMTMLDILNEPESKNIGWNYGGPIGGATNMYLRAMDALYKVAPSTPPSAAHHLRCLLQGWPQMPEVNTTTDQQCGDLGAQNATR